MSANTNTAEAKEQHLMFAYRGAELYRRIAEHAEKMEHAGSGVLSTPTQRMEMLALRIGRLDENAVPDNALYEVSIWILLYKGHREFRAMGCNRLLGSSARRGNDSARFLVAKACLDGICWAVDEMRRTTRDGRPFDLARSWLKNLSEKGYVDARMEFGSDLWERGMREEALDAFSSIADTCPDALVRLGLHLLPEEPDRALDYIDCGEFLGGGKGALFELERALKTSC